MMRPVRALALLLLPAMGCSLEAATTHVPLSPGAQALLLIRSSSPMTAEALRTEGASSLSVPGAKEPAFVLQYACPLEALGLSEGALELGPALDPMLRAIPDTATVARIDPGADAPVAADATALSGVRLNLSDDRCRARSADLRFSGTAGKTPLAGAWLSGDEVVILLGAAQGGELIRLSPSGIVKRQPLAMTPSSRWAGAGQGDGQAYFLDVFAKMMVVDAELLLTELPSPTLHRPSLVALSARGGTVFAVTDSRDALRFRRPEGWTAINTATVTAQSGRISVSAANAASAWASDPHQASLRHLEEGGVTDEALGVLNERDYVTGVAALPDRLLIGTDHGLLLGRRGTSFVQLDKIESTVTAIEALGTAVLYGGEQGLLTLLSRDSFTRCAQEKLINQTLAFAVRVERGVYLVPERKKDPVGQDEFTVTFVRDAELPPSCGGTR